MSPEAARPILPAAARVAATPASVNRIEPARAAAGCARGDGRPPWRAPRSCCSSRSSRSARRGSPRATRSGPTGPRSARRRRGRIRSGPTISGATSSRASSGGRASRCRPASSPILLAIAVGVPTGPGRRLLPRARFDQVIMRLTDAWLAFPFLILAIGLVTILGPSLTNATVAIGLGATPTYIRLTRGLVLATQEEDYVQGARAARRGRLPAHAPAHPAEHRQRAARAGHRVHPRRRSSPRPSCRSSASACSRPRRAGAPC